MPFVNAKCTNCGANLEVDSSNEAAICQYCGAAYIVEKAINNYHVNNHNTIHAQVVNIYGGNTGVNNDDEEISLYEEIEDMIQEMKEYIQEINDSEPRLLTPDDMFEFLDAAFSEEENAEELKKLVYDYVNSISISFDFSYFSQDDRLFNNLWISYQKLWERAGHKNRSGEDFYKWVFETDTEAINEYEIMGCLQKKLTEYYIQLVKDGRLTFVIDQDDSKNISLWGVYANNNFVFIDFDKKVRNKYLIPFFHEGVENAEKINNFLRLDSNSENSNYFFLFHLGKYGKYRYRNGRDCYEKKDMDTFIKEIENERAAKHQEIVNQQRLIEQRMRNNLCKYCGGRFKGVFSKVCSQCGTAKDY